MSAEDRQKSRYHAQRFDDWTTDWTLPWLCWALMNLDPVVAWGSSLGCALVVGELRWYLYPDRLWSNKLFDKLLTFCRWGFGLWTAGHLWLQGRFAEGMLVIALLFILGVAYSLVVWLIWDSRRVRKYQTHHHNVFFHRFLGRPL